MKTLSFDQCCDEVAQKHGFTDWDSLDIAIDEDDHKWKLTTQHWKEAAELFAREKVKEAVKIAFEKGELWERYQNREIDTAKSMEDTAQEILEKLGL